MKTYFKIFLLSLSLFITSCSDDMFTYNTNEEQKAGQMITGAGDCITNKAWSWSNGVATTIDSYEGARFFNFKAMVSGKLSFSYTYTDYRLFFLQVTVNNKVFFQTQDYEDVEYDGYSEVSVGSVETDDVVEFLGLGCRVKDIKIVGK